MWKLVAFAILVAALTGCEEMFPEPDYTITIVNESDYMLDVYWDGSRKGTVNSIPALKAEGEGDMIQQFRLNTMDIEGVSKGSHTLRVLYKDCIDLSTLEQCETVEEINVDANLEITID